MPCPFASPFASTASASQSVIPLTASTFETTGQLTITKLTLDKIFVELAKSIPFVSSNANSYITCLVSKTFEPNFKPTYFQIPYIYSACDNLVNGIYKESSSVEDNIIITKYEIPYKRQNKEEIVIITTYLNTLTNILFYEVPSEFTYNSLKQASVAVTTLSDGSFSGKIAIPTTFTSLLFPQYPNRFLPFTINPDSDNVNLANLKVKSSYQTTCNGTPLGGGCSSSGLTEDNCAFYYDYDLGKSRGVGEGKECRWNGSYCSDGGPYCNNLPVCPGSIRESACGSGGGCDVDYSSRSGAYYQCVQGTGTSSEQCYSGSQCQEP